MAECVNSTVLRHDKRILRTGISRVTVKGIWKLLKHAFTIKISKLYADIYTVYTSWHGKIERKEKSPFP